MKSFLLCVSLAISVCQAQPKPDLQLMMPNESFGGSNGSAVVWHPLQKKYIAAMAGNASFPLAIFDANGKRLSAEDQSCQYDIRGLWFHPEKQLVQGNAYDNGGWFAYSISNSYQLAGKTLQEGMHQPGPHSVGNYFPSKKSVGFLNGNKITFYNPNSGEVDVENSIALQPLYPNLSFPDDLAEGYNETTVLYTGMPGKEIGLLNVDEAQVELYDIKSGKCTGVAPLPEGLEYVYNMFNFAYANQLYWFFDKETRSWNGFKLKVKSPPSPSSLGTAAASTPKATETKTVVGKGADLYNQSLVQKNAKNYSSAISLMESAIQNNYANADSYYQLAWMQSETGNYNGALSTTQKAIGAGISDPRLLEEKAFANKKLGRYVDAIVAYQNAIRAAPEKANLYRHLGDCYRLNGNASAAESQYLTCLQKDPTHYWANYEMGITNSLRGDYTAAQSYFEKAVQKDPAIYEGMLELGYAQYKLKKNDDALATLRKAAAAHPQQAGPHKIMGDVYRQNYSPIKTTESMQAYQKALSLDKTNVGACYGLGWLYNSQSQYDNAISVLEQALQKNRKEKNVLTELGYSYYAKKSYMTSLTFLNEAIAIDPNLKTALYYAGLCHCGLKDKTAAQGIYTKLLAVDATNAAKLKTSIDAL